MASAQTVVLIFSRTRDDMVIGGTFFSNVDICGANITIQMPD